MAGKRVVEVKKVKRLKGTQNSITLSPYIQSQLEKLVEKKQISKSAIVTIAIEKYAREELGNSEAK